MRSGMSFLVLLATITIAATAAHAQSLWIPRDREKSVLLEAMKPGVEFVKEDFFTMAAFFGARFPVGPKTSLVVEVPFARLQGDYFLFIGSSGFSEATLGNVYLGLEAHGIGSPFFGELGVRAPTTNENDDGAALTGTFSDVGRFNTFLPHVASFTGAFNVRTVSPGGIASRLRLGGSFAVSTEGGDPEVFGLYAWQTGYEGRCLRVGVAASGTALITQSVGNLGSRTMNELELHADFGSGRIRPGVDGKLPLGPASSYVSGVVGVSVSIGFGSAP